MANRTAQRIKNDPVSYGAVGISFVRIEPAVLWMAQFPKRGSPIGFGTPSPYIT